MSFARSDVAFHPSGALAVVEPVFTPGVIHTPRDHGHFAFVAKAQVVVVDQWSGIGVPAAGEVVDRELHD
ncbi:unannotated protein [freshwater metagenome]|uniref:Unannotated protein n=1 Tax=freshwater metagenome TaxID=449393 RepID=A0A6J6CAQ2_9ZZZZ